MRVCTRITPPAGIKRVIVFWVDPYRPSEVRVRESVATGPATFSSDVVAAQSNWLDRLALAQIRQSVASAPLRFGLWDGFELPPISGSPIATIVFKNRRALLSWVWDPDLNFGEAYMFGAVEIHGDLLEVLESIYRSSVVKPKPWR